MKRILFLMVLSVLCLGTLYSQSANQLTRVAVVDFNEVYSRFGNQSRRVREHEERTAAFQREIENRSNAIRDLQGRRAEAAERNNQTEVTRLDNDIQRRSEDLRNFHQTRSEQLENELRALREADSSYDDVKRWIGRWAVSNGYSIVLDINNTGIIWFDHGVIVTANVLRHLENPNNRR